MPNRKNDSNSSHKLMAIKKQSTPNINVYCSWRQKRFLNRDIMTHRQSWMPQSLAMFIFNSRTFVSPVFSRFESRRNSALDPDDVVFFNHEEIRLSIQTTSFFMTGRWPLRHGLVFERIVSFTDGYRPRRLMSRLLICLKMRKYPVFLKNWLGPVRKDPPDRNHLPVVWNHRPSQRKHSSLTQKSPS